MSEPATVPRDYPLRTTTGQSASSDQLFELIEPQRLTITSTSPPCSHRPPPPSAPQDLPQTLPQVHRLPHRLLCRFNLRSAFTSINLLFDHLLPGPPPRLRLLSRTSSAHLPRRVLGTFQAPRAPTRRSPRPPRIPDSPALARERNMDASGRPLAMRRLHHAGALQREDEW